MNLDNISDLESFWAEQIKSWQSTDLTRLSRSMCFDNLINSWFMSSMFSRRILNRSF